MASIACTPIGVRPPSGVSARSRAMRRLRNSALGNVIVASTCRIVPSSPARITLAQLAHLRMEAAVVADAERDAGLADAATASSASRLVSVNGFSQ